MTKDEMKNKYSAFITEISEILGLGKPVDILKLCATTDLFFQPLEKRIAKLEKENAELKEINSETLTQLNLDNGELIIENEKLRKENAELKADNDARKFAMAMSEKVEKQLREQIKKMKRHCNCKHRDSEGYCEVKRTYLIDLSYDGCDKWELED